MRLCKRRVHGLCMHHAQCFKCVFCICHEPPSADMRHYKTYKHLVHSTWAVHVACCVEVVYKTHTPRPQVASQPAKQYKRHFKP